MSPPSVVTVSRATGLFFPVREICPPLVGVHRFGRTGERVSRYPGQEVEVRAVVEHQMLSRRLHANTLGYTTGTR